MNLYYIYYLLEKILKAIKEILPKLFQFFINRMYFIIVKIKQQKKDCD